MPGTTPPSPLHLVERSGYSLFYLRNIPDTEELIKASENAGEAVVVGGGFIGLELASSLRQRGMDVTLVYMEDRVWAQMLTPEIAHWLESGECTLLDLSDSIPIVTGEGSDFEVFAIPAEFYPNQEKRIRTLMTGNVLVCRTELDQDLVFELEDAFFNNIGNLLLTLTSTGCAARNRVSRLSEGF